MFEIGKMKERIRAYKHQQDAVKFILSRGGVGALFMDCGTENV